MMNLKINILQNELGYTVQLTGEIDAYTASDLKNK
ncbi:anti-anti sigma factor, partial [Bacillus thuringiensis]|nr:anti-anti sigma factor [Bacillus thuringiensis]